MKRYDLFVFNDCLDMTAERSIISNVSSQMHQKQSDKVMVEMGECGFK